VRSFYGIESLNEAVKGGNLDHVQLGRGVMTGMLGHVGLGSTVLGFGQTEMPVRTTGCFNPTGYALGVLVDMSRPSQFWGSETQSGSILICPPGTEADATVPGTHAYGYLIVPPSIWEAAVEALAPSETQTLVKRRGVINPTAALGTELNRRVRALMELIATGQPFAAQASTAAAEELQTLLVRAATSGKPSEEPCGRYFRHRQIVSRAEDYLHDHLGENVYTREICEHCGVSERTLQYAFREILGMTPTAYLRRRRLSAIRRELTANGRPPVSVTDAAMRWGFWHLGEFATAYRGLFGESPTETVRRRLPG
jgi:AraC family ethanolamine operon transcriptional activator